MQTVVWWELLGWTSGWAWVRSGPAGGQGHQGLQGLEAGGQGPFLERLSGELFPHSERRTHSGTCGAWGLPGLGACGPGRGLPGCGARPGIAALPGFGPNPGIGAYRGLGPGCRSGPASSGLQVGACPGGPGPARNGAARSAPPARRPLAPPRAPGGPCTSRERPGAAGEAGPGGRAGPGRRRGRAGARSEEVV